MEKAKVLEKEYNQISRKPMPRMQETPWVSSGFLQDAYEMDLAGIDAAIAKRSGT